eukprot:1493893-Amphidinium_carterae.3
MHTHILQLWYSNITSEVRCRCRVHNLAECACASTHHSSYWRKAPCNPATSNVGSSILVFNLPYHIGGPHYVNAFTIASAHVMTHSCVRGNTTWR